MWRTISGLVSKIFSAAEGKLAHKRNHSENNENKETVKNEPSRADLSFWDYSDQYRLITEEGNSKPTPAFGSPTFVKHIGIWQKTQSDENKSIDIRDPIKRKFKHYDAHNEEFFKEVNRFLQELQEKGRVLPPARTSDLTPPPCPNTEKFKFESFGRTAGSRQRENLGHRPSHKFKFFQPQSVTFTLWWLDSDKNGNWVENTCQKRPDFSSIRVRVQAQSHWDHVTISFFIDAAKPYGNRQIYDGEEGLARAEGDVKKFGYRREKIIDYLKDIRAVSSRQIETGRVNKDRLPEGDLKEEEAKKLLAAADYFYEGIWQEFMRSFGIEDMAERADAENQSNQSDEEALESETTSSTNLVNLIESGERFADSRGVVMSIKGLPTERNERRDQKNEELAQRLQARLPEDPLEQKANVGIGHLNNFDYEDNEPNTILKSLWPFLRRMIPWADDRDFVGCGLINQRLLYVSPLGLSGDIQENEEEPIVDSDEEKLERLHLPKATKDWRQVKRHPQRYLILTRGEPHREQLGRFVDLLNLVNIKRLFALKNLSTVKNASVHLRLLGRELDSVLESWGMERQLIEDRYQWELFKLKNPVIVLALEGKWPQGTDHRDGRISYRRRLGIAQEVKKRYEDGPLQKISDFVDKLNLLSVARAVSQEEVIFNYVQSVESPEEQSLADKRIKKLSNLIRHTEQQLVEIGAALDNIGNGGAGRMTYVVNRSKDHIEEVRRLVKELDVRNVQGWINYEQFVQRNLMSTFEMIRGTNDRLGSLRERLQIITDMIQTSALIVETEATRANTATLRKIASNFWFLAAPVIFVIVWNTVDIIFDFVWSGSGYVKAVAQFAGVFVSYLFIKYHEKISKLWRPIENSEH